MRCLHIINDLALGGTQSLALRTMRALSDSGVDVELCVLAGKGKTYSWSWLPSVKYLSLGCDYRKPWEVRRLVTALQAQLVKSNPDLLHSWLWTSDFVTARANARGVLPHLSHIVDRRAWQESSCLKHKFRRWITRTAFRKSKTKFIAVSYAARDFAIRTLSLDPSSVEVAWNSIECETFSHSDNSPFYSGKRSQLLLGMASRMEPEKGHTFLIDALPLIREAGIDARLLITGEGTYRNQLARQVAALNLKDWVEFVGFVDSVPKFLDSIDIFVVPSIDSEGLPTTILESMAAKRLVIATDIGGAGEAIRNGIDGVVIPSRNSQAIAQAVVTAAKDAARTEIQTAAAKLRVHESFSMNAMMKVILGRYKSLTCSDR